MMMVSTLDAIKGGAGGGSVRIGATGTISSLMGRELASVKRSPQSPKSSLRKSPTIPVSVPCVSRTKRQSRTVVDEASTRGSSSNHGGPGSTRKARSSIRNKAHSVPMLGSDDIVIDNSHNRKKTDKKGSYIVEVVDLKCGSHERAWSNSITHQFRKLSFSKLSQSFS
ncbi:uncharacterized protein LOC122641440 isoform X1 [Telopea speciosissima]|uniref:uncharacterized protein LOC122641440 isoform X1 n=1 Tax=Telopea speciosissima TaxID=54955 RepID=UPI001CC730A9|nr:uncharacterized protein LOC122641440 isoform X1 [Telopea speciosissima]